VKPNAPLFDEFAANDRLLRRDRAGLSLVCGPGGAELSQSGLPKKHETVKIWPVTQGDFMMNFALT
jgi:hypothetical protein